MAAPKSAGTSRARTTTTTKKAAAKKPTARKPVAKKPVVEAPPAELYLEYAGRDEAIPEVWHACSTDQSRPILLHPWLERVGPRSQQRLFLCATDSYQGIRVPVRLVDDSCKPHDVPEELVGLLHVDAIKAWRKALVANPYGVRLRVARDTLRLKFLGGSQEWTRPDGTPPRFTQLIPLDNYTKAVEPYAVGFNPAILAKTVKAIGLGGKSNRAAVIRFQEAKDAEHTGTGAPALLRPMLLTSDQKPVDKLDDFDTIAIVMPIRVNV